MKVHCSTLGCDGMSNRLNGKCRDCKATTVTLPAVLEVPQTPVAAASPGVAAPVERPVAGKAATGSPRCGSCGLVFPLLVDDVLCIRCDSLHYPAVLYPAAVAS